LQGKSYCQIQIILGYIVGYILYGQNVTDYNNSMSIGCNENWKRKSERSHAARCSED